MNALPNSLHRRTQIEWEADSQDDRQDWEKLRDAVNAHLENKLYRAKLDTFNVSEADVRRADAACDRTYSDLACLIEDTFCVSAARLAKALAS